jgi:RHS repeat-associated protein
MGLAWLAVPVRAQVVEYYHTDAIGNIRVITDASGNVIERHDYLPFGEECTTGACASNPQVGQGEPKKFTGKERDAETGLDYFGARYYGSKVGRFTTVDPVYTWQENLTDPQRWNRYAYARNNPLRFVDPDGKAVLANAMPSAQALQRNAEIRTAVMSVMKFDPFLQDQALVGMALGMALPASPSEFTMNQLTFILGMAMPLEAGPVGLLSEKAGPVAGVSPSEVMGRTPTEIGVRAEQLGLEARGPNPAQGRGAYIDPQTGQQRILTHPDATPPHAHVNNPAGQRIGPSGATVPRNSPEAHLPIKPQ